MSDNNKTPESSKHRDFKEFCLSADPISYFDSPCNAMLDGLAEPVMAEDNTVSHVFTSEFCQRHMPEAHKARKALIEEFCRVCSPATYNLETLDALIEGGYALMVAGKPVFTPAFFKHYSNESIQLMTERETPILVMELPKPKPKPKSKKGSKPS